MKLLCVIDNLGSGGAQRQIVNIACALKERGHEVAFYTYFRSDHFSSQLQARDIAVHFHPKTSRFSPAPLLALRRLIRKGRFTAVLAFLETPAVYAELACIGLSRTRLIVGERSTVPGGRPSRRRSLKFQLHRLSHAVVTNSHSHRTWIATHYAFIRPKLHCIWNGVDANVFFPGSRSNESHGELRLLGIGRISPAKNLTSLAAALRQCRKAGIAVTIDWAGIADDQRYHKEVLSVIEDAGVAEAWRWLGERRDVPMLMRRYDALILPSVYEGLPNVVCEALTSGLPVLASDVSDNSLLVQEGRTGFLFDAMSVASISEGIARFARLTNDERVDMGIEGRAFAVSQLSLAACVDAYERLLSQTI